MSIVKFSGWKNMSACKPFLYSIPLAKFTVPELLNAIPYVKKLLLKYFVFKVKNTFGLVLPTS